MKRRINPYVILYRTIQALLIGIYIVKSNPLFLHEIE